MSRAKKNWMQKSVIHKGGLHKALRIPQDKKIPQAKLEKAEHSKNPHLKKMAVLAETFKKYRG